MVTVIHFKLAFHESQGLTTYQASPVAKSVSPAYIAPLYWLRFWDAQL